MLFFILLISGCSFNTSAGNFKEDKNVALGEIQLFHDRINHKQYDTIFEQSSARLQKDQDRATVVNVLKENHKEFGNFIKIKESRMKVLINRVPIEIRGVCVSEFDTGDVTELFIFTKEEGKVKLLNFQFVKGAVDMNEFMEEN
jgi:hypothetical protein